MIRYTKKPLSTQDSGFTLIELLMVLAILIIISIATLPLLSGQSDTTQLRIFAEEVGNELRLAQTLARSHGRSVRATFSYTERKITLAYEGDIRTPLKEPLVAPTGIHFGTSTSTSVTRSISFSPLGSTFHNGAQGTTAYSTVLTHERSGKRYEVVIAAVNSGRIRVTPLN